jgi:hypothetical protein
MALPGPDDVKDWGGKLIVDRTGAPIGTVTQVFTDDDTGLPEWATFQLGEATVFLPLVDAVEEDGQVKVMVRRDDVARAPVVGDRHHITPEEEERLYRYYGIPYSPKASRSVLPEGEGPVGTPSRRTPSQRGPGTAVGGRSPAAVAARVTQGRDPVVLAALAAAVFALATAIGLVVRRRSSGASH